MSSANNNKKAHKTVLASSTSPGGSASTFRGFVCYLDAQGPDFFIWENVDTLAESEGSGSEQNCNLDIAMAEFASRGYDVKVYLLASVEFGLPQNRMRIYAVGLKLSSAQFSFANVSIAETFHSLTNNLENCRRAPPSYSDILLKGGDPAIAHEREWRTSNPTEGQWEPASIDRHMAEYSKMGVPWGGLVLDTATTSSADFKFLVAREKDALTVFRKKYPKSPAVDVSQRIDRTLSLAVSTCFGDLQTTVLVGVEQASPSPLTGFGDLRAFRSLFASVASGWSSAWGCPSRYLRGPPRLRKVHP
jgi:site-specific DNA-cytosine methylase